VQVPLWDIFRLGPKCKITGDWSVTDRAPF